jgi:hypothetical protein
MAQFSHQSHSHRRAGDPPYRGPRSGADSAQGGEPGEWTDCWSKGTTYWGEHVTDDEYQGV